MSVSEPTRASPKEETEFIIELEGITKRFPGVLANDRVDLKIKKGEIHTLLGENGAGKSTLMKILYGLYHRDEGSIRVKGDDVHFKNARDATTYGIGMVHQHFTLVDSFSVAESIMLGTVTLQDIVRSPKKFTRDINAMAREVNKVADRFGFKINPYDKIWQLSAGEQQRVEILKAVYGGIDVLILDEPTSVLAPQEVQDFFGVLKEMNQKGLTIIFITHILDEALQISDRITVLRDARVVCTIPVAEATKKKLANLMVGRDVLFQYHKSPANFGNMVLEVDKITAKNPRGLIGVRDLSLKIRAGEIYGIAAIAGNGQKELGEVLTGNRKTIDGTIKISGIDATNKNAKFFIAQGVGHIPEERMEIGVDLEASLVENTLITRLFEPCFCKGRLIDWESVESCTQGMIDEFDVKTSGITSHARNLSGGNIQKFILARELTKEPKLIIAVHPTMGLDVAATEDIRNKLLDARDNQAAILLISESIEEVMAISDTIGVMFKGEIVGQFPAEETDKNQLGYLMTGGHKDD